MNVNTEGGLDLTSHEVTALALHIIARKLEDHDYWLEWEDYPRLSQTAFLAVANKIGDLARQELGRSRSFNMRENIDSAHVLEAATS